MFRVTIDRPVVVHLAGEDDVRRIKTSLAYIHHQLEQIMATKQEVLDAVKAEAEEVASRLNALATQVTDLQAQVAAGTATAQDWQDVKDAVQGIFTAA